MDSELTHLLNLLRISPEDEASKEIEKSKYKEIEKAAGETTRRIDEL